MNALIVEDEMIIGIDLESKLKKAGVNSIGIARNLDQANELMRPDVQLVFLDINLDGKEDGIDVAKVLRKKFQFYAVFLSASSNQQIIDKANTLGESEYIKKPFDAKIIYEAIQRAKKDLKLELEDQN